MEAIDDKSDMELPSNILTSWKDKTEFSMRRKNTTARTNLRTRQTITRNAQNRDLRLKFPSVRDCFVTTVLLLLALECREFVTHFAEIKTRRFGVILAEATVLTSPEESAICSGEMSFGSNFTVDSSVRAKNSASPVKFRFLSRNYLTNFPLKVVVYTDGGQDINSFYLQAHEIGLTTQIGTFNAIYSDRDVALLSCSGSTEMKNTATTKSGIYRKRSKVTLYWNPPLHCNRTIVFRINALTNDGPSTGWRGLTSVEIVPTEKKECYSESGSEYRGTISRTKSGLKCQRWDSQTPHSHSFKPTTSEFAEKDLLSDFCRQPDDSAQPWCFTTSSEPAYERCDVPKCAANSGRQAHFIEFGETAGDTKLRRGATSIGRLNFTFEFPMINENYSSVSVFEDGVLVLGKGFDSLNGFDLSPEGSFTLVGESSTKDQSAAVVAPFWTEIERNSSEIGQGYVFYRESKEPDVLIPLGDVIKGNLRAAGKEYKESAKSEWAFIATWHLVSDNASQSDVSNLNSFQVVLARFGDQSFVILNYDMRKWTSKNHTALIGYKAGDAFRFLNHSLPYTKVSQFEVASSLGRAVTDQSNVKRNGQLMYEISLCNEQDAATCRDSLTLRLRAPKKTASKSPPDEPAQSRRSDQNSNACLGVECGENGRCVVPDGECVCDAGFSGALCEINIDDCDSNPCQNGGACSDGINRYNCSCRPGYTGSRCEQDINDCLSQPCQNKGTCIDQENKYLCNCTAEFTGNNCETPTDQCVSKPCKNGGTCYKASGSYACACASGFSGKECDLKICFDGLLCKNSYPCNDHHGKSNCSCQKIDFHTGYCHRGYEISTTTELPACPESRTGSDASGYISWPTTVDGGSAIGSCPTPTTSDAIRICNSGRWQEPDISACGQLSSTSLQLQDLARSAVIAANASEVAGRILNMTSQGADQLVAYDIANVADILLKVVDVSGTEIDYAISDDVVNVVSNVVEAPGSEMRAASLEFSSNSKLIKVVDDVLLKLEITTDEPVYLDSKNVKAGISSVTGKETFKGTSFSLSSNLQPAISDGQNPFSTSDSSSIQIPASIANGVAPSEFNRIQFTVYTGTELFDYVRVDNGTTPVTRQSSNFTIFSDFVVSASVGDTKIENLKENITITINKSDFYYGKGPYCVFYQFPDDGGEGSWSTDGCHMKESTSTQIVCECDHLTNFAAIMDVYGTVEYLDEYQQMILRILTYIGCSLSIFGLLCTLISYTIFQKIRKEAPAKILICLCTALIAVNVVYLCMQSAYYSSPTTCVAVAAVMHYALLSSLMWMGLEAINMYIALVKVFNTYYRRYMLKMSLVGWGVPLLIVLIAFIVQFATGVPSYTMNSKTEICWLRREVFYGTLVAPFGIVFLFNCVIYCLVLAQLLGMSSRKLKHLDSARKMRKPAKRENARKLRGAVGLMALLGISWGFALGTIDKAALTFAYVFVVFNSSQGFWVFIFHCVLKKEVSKSWKKLLFNKGGDFREGSSRWNRFSSSNTRSTTTTSTRSMSASSIRTSYLVPRSSRSVRRSEASIGMDSKGLDVVIRSNSLGYANEVFDDEDPGPPPPFPPPPVPQEERIVRRIRRRTDAGPSNTIATQTDVNYLEPRDTDSQVSTEDGSDHSVEEDERRDSVDDNFGIRDGVLHFPPHREVVMSPSNESGIYSDASVSSAAPLADVMRFRRAGNDVTATRRTHDVNGGAMSRTSVSKTDSNNSTASSSGSEESLDRPREKFALYGNRNSRAASFTNDTQTIDSGVSMASDAMTDDSPSTSRSEGGRSQLLTQDSRSSLYSISSNVSSSSALSSETESAVGSNTRERAAPHVWKPPLVIKRGEDPRGDSNNRPKPVLTGKISHRGAAKRGLWKKNRKEAQSLDDAAVESSNLSPARRRTRQKLLTSQSLDEDETSNVATDVKMTDFSLSRGNFYRGAS